MPVVLLITSDPQGASLCDPYPQGEGTSGVLTGVMPSVAGLLATHNIRAQAAERSLVQLIEGRERPPGSCEDRCVLELPLAPGGRSEAARAVSLRRNQYNDPPLGWSLSRASQVAIDDRIDDADIRSQIKCIANLARGQACTTAQRCTRTAAPATGSAIRMELPEHQPNS